MDSSAKVTARLARAEKSVDEDAATSAEAVSSEADGDGEPKANKFRRLAQAHEREAAQSDSAEEREAQLRLARSYLALAENEEWLEGRAAPKGPERR